MYIYKKSLIFNQRVKKKLINISQVKTIEFVAIRAWVKIKKIFVFIKFGSVYR